MNDYPFSKKVDLSRFGRDQEVKIIRFKVGSGTRQSEATYYPTYESRMRLEAVVHGCGDAEIAINDDNLEIEVYFKCKCKISDFARKQLFDRAVSDRRAQEVRQALRNATKASVK